jgi:hypothetical protein
MKTSFISILTVLLLTPSALLAQEIVKRGPIPVKAPQGISAVEFPATTNASQVSVSFVTGYQFTVNTPVALNALGGILQGAPAQPIFGSLPASLPVSLWDDARNLLATATVSASDPLVGHFHYHAVSAVRLQPGVTYTIAALIPAGHSVLSDVPALAPGAAVNLAGGLSTPSTTLVFPTGDTIGRKSYFGPSFTYLSVAPVVGPTPIGPAPIRRPLPMGAAAESAPAAAPVAAQPMAPAMLPVAASVAAPASDPAVAPVAAPEADSATAPDDLPAAKADPADSQPQSKENPR